MNTHSLRVIPADLRLQFREAHQQHHVELPIVAHYSSAPNLACIVCRRNISNHMAESLKTLFYDREYGKQEKHHEF